MKKEIKTIGLTIIATFVITAAVFGLGSSESAPDVVTKFSEVIEPSMGAAAGLSISISISSLDASRVTGIYDAFASLYNRPTEIEDVDGEMIPNPVTKQEFFENQIKDHIDTVEKGYMKKNKIETAKSEADDDISNRGDITIQ